MTRSWAWVFAAAVALILVTGALALGWHWLKKNRPKFAKNVFWVGTGLMILYLIFRK